MSNTFLFTALYGYWVHEPLIVWSSLICFFTSTAHYYRSQTKLLQTMNRLCVTTVAACFLLYDFITLGYTFYLHFMYIFAIATFICFFYVLARPYFYEKYYCLINTVAITSMIVCSLLKLIKNVPY